MREEREREEKERKRKEGVKEKKERKERKRERKEREREKRETETERETERRERKKGVSQGAQSEAGIDFLQPLRFCPFRALKSKPKATESAGERKGEKINPLRWTRATETGPGGGQEKDSKAMVALRVLLFSFLAIPAKVVEDSERYFHFPRGLPVSVLSACCIFISPEAYLCLVLSACRNSAMATSPASMATGSIFVIPSNGANVIQTAPGLPGVALQASGATPYLQYGAQQLGISTSAPQQVPQKGPMERFLSAEAKVLGAVQIMIGLIHIGFGAVAICLYPYNLTVSRTGGYPFWGGLFFISTGLLCVVAANRSSHDLMQSSIGMNIASATMALTGIVMCIYQMIVSTIPQYDTARIIPTMHFVPYQVIGNGAVTTETNCLPPPPTYDKEGEFRKESSRRLGSTPSIAALPVKGPKRVSRKLRRASVEGKGGGNLLRSLGLLKEVQGTEGGTDAEAVITAYVLLFLFLVIPAKDVEESKGLKTSSFKRVTCLLSFSLLCVVLIGCCT
ncbi:membrane-spanning 4-domains subfamily A member 15-like [Crotalus adamanteus]|uniref:Membrane-spanning 4-domains subfamily A member 15-like n=1 Tax=Crotalus adamanteus TaxID=8729 RepID=A0AAW1C8C3_CROAD